MKNETRRDESCHTLERRERLAPSRQEGILGGTMTSATPSTCDRCGEPLPEGGEDCPTCQTEAQAETPEVEGPSASTADLPRAAAGPTGPAEAPTPLEGKTRRERARPRDLARIGGFEIERELARGGMGVVYLAHSPALDRQVALKVLLAGAFASDGARERFQIEAQATARLRHAHIVGVHQVGLHHGDPYLVMDYIEGESLAARLKHDEPLEVREAAQMCERLAQALVHAHSHAILHRDLKPANVLLTPEGEPVLTDFGLAKRQEETRGITVSGQVLGTPAYMPPEQARGDLDHTDRRSDVYSLGATLYELLTGRPPFKGSNVVSLLAQVVQDEPTSPSQLRPELDPDLETICLKCLEKEPQRRYATAQALADDLGRFLRQEPILARPPSTQERLQKWVRRNQTLARGLGGVLAAALLVIAVGTALFVSNLKEARDEAEAQTVLAEANAKEAEANAIKARDQKALAEAKTQEVQAEKERAEVEKERAEAEKQRAEAANEEIQKRLGQIERLADITTLKDLRKEAEALWPPSSEKVEQLEAWLEKATALGGRAPGHREQLLALQKQQAQGEEAKVQRWEREGLESLLGDLEAFLDPDPFRGTVASVTSRLAFASQVKARSLESPAARAAWERARAGVRASPRYAGLDLEALEGLFPIGPDPDSGLWEFWHVQSGERPERGADGRLALREETGLVLVLIPGGEFLMGSPEDESDRASNEGPVHRVKLRPFLLSKYELTQGQWLRVSGQNPSQHKAGTVVPPKKLATLLHPVENVSWNDAQEFLPRLGLGLPSEAQWEYACRAGTTTAWWSGDSKASLQGKANLADLFCKQNGAPPSWQYEESLNDGHTVHAPIGSFQANAFGLHDTAGNVFEWVQDAWHGNYQGAPTDGSAWEAAGASLRVYRGGGWNSNAWSCRAAYRYGNEPGKRYSLLGFRLSRSLGP